MVVRVSDIDGLFYCNQKVSYLDGQDDEIWDGVGIVPSWLENAEVCAIECEGGTICISCAILFDYETGTWDVY